MNKKISAQEVLEYIADKGLEYPDKPFNTIIKALELLDKVERGGDRFKVMLHGETDNSYTVGYVDATDEITNNYILIERESND